MAAYDKNKPYSMKINLIPCGFRLYARVHCTFYTVCPTVYHGAINRSAEHTVRINCPKSISDWLPSNFNTWHRRWPFIVRIPELENLDNATRTVAFSLSLVMSTSLHILERQGMCAVWPKKGIF